MNRNLIELRLCITCASCGENRVRTVHVAPASSVMADASVYYVNADNYRVCIECERTDANSAHTLRANIEARRRDATRNPRTVDAILRNLALSTHPEPLTNEERNALAQHLALRVNAAANDASKGALNPAS